MADQELLLEAISALGDPEDFVTPDGYSSLALCVIDSIWSMGVRYGGVENVIGRYRDLRRAQGAEGNDDGASQLVQTIAEAGGPEEFAAQVKNYQRTSTKSGILKADAVSRAAKIFVDANVLTTQALSSLSADEVARLEEEWTKIPGQSSGISWKYFLMLSGAPGVKPDRMIRRFIADALNRDSENDVSVEEAVDLITGAATDLKIDPTTLDHQIWLYQRSSY